MTLAMPYESHATDLINTERERERARRPDFDNVYLLVVSEIHPSYADDTMTQGKLGLVHFKCSSMRTNERNIDNPTSVVHQNPAHGSYQILAEKGFCCFVRFSFGGKHLTPFVLSYLAVEDSLPSIGHWLSVPITSLDSAHDRDFDMAPRISAGAYKTIAQQLNGIDCVSSGTSVQRTSE